MELREEQEYLRLGLDGDAVRRLSLLGDLLLQARSNVTAIRDPERIETFHFLDSLSLLRLPEVASANSMIDLGSGAGLPALVLALALPGASVTALESVKKKCAFISRAVEQLELSNVSVICGRAEEIGRSSLRDTFDVSTARALAPLPVVLEYALPLVRRGGLVVAMKGAMSDQERTAGEEAAGILGGTVLPMQQVRPFAEAENRWFYLVQKTKATPREFPRKAGTPSKRPLGMPGGGTAQP